jgi:hypothetical protein
VEQGFFYKSLKSIALPSLWGETLISRWLKRRKFVNFSKTDERALFNVAFGVVSESLTKVNSIDIDKILS